MSSPCPAKTTSSPEVYDRQKARDKFLIPENLAFFKARAKYVPDFENGGLRLASVCAFNRPIFNPDDLVPACDPLDLVRRIDPDEVNDEGEDGDEDDTSSEGSSEDSLRRSIRRARLNVFDLAICNKFDLFSTLTFAPENVDRESYAETYRLLKIWLSNRVQRKGLKYIAVPEYHPTSKTAIHFHMLSNSDPVDLVDSGHWAHHEKVYNIPSWQAGFSTAQYIKGENAVDFTSKYICKYMSKSNGNKVGGRFYLSGGDLVRPTYIYADSIEELCDPSLVPKYERNIQKDWGSFQEISYI